MNTWAWFRSFTDLLALVFMQATVSQPLPTTSPRIALTLSRELDLFIHIIQCSMPASVRYGNSFGINMIWLASSSRWYTASEEAAVVSQGCLRSVRRQRSTFSPSKLQDLRKYMDLQEVPPICPKTVCLTKVQAGIQLWLRQARSRPYSCLTASVLSAHLCCWALSVMLRCSSSQLHPLAAKAIATTQRRPVSLIPFMPSRLRYHFIWDILRVTASLFVPTKKGHLELIVHDQSTSSDQSLSYGHHPSSEEAPSPLLLEYRTRTVHHPLMLVFLTGAHHQPTTHCVERVGHQSSCHRDCHPNQKSQGNKGLPQEREKTIDRVRQTEVESSI